jgi:hypothetical protein
MANIRYIKTRYSLVNAAESLIVAYWTHDTFHVENAREALTQALCGDGDREVLIDVIEEAIADAHDVDATMRDYAKSVVDALLDHAVPLTAEKGDA